MLLIWEDRLVCPVWRKVPGWECPSAPAPGPGAGPGWPDGSAFLAVPSAALCRSRREAGGGGSAERRPPSLPGSAPRAWAALCAAPCCRCVLTAAVQRHRGSRGTDGENGCCRDSAVFKCGAAFPPLALSADHYHLLTLFEMWAVSLLPTSV